MQNDMLSEIGAYPYLYFIMDCMMAFSHRSDLLLRTAAASCFAASQEILKLKAIEDFSAPRRRAAQKAAKFDFSSDSSDFANSEDDFNLND